MRALLASTLLSLQIVLLSAHPHTSQESGDQLLNSSQEPGGEHVLNSSQKSGEHVLSRQTRESHHLSRPSSPDTRRSRVPPASPRPSRAFRLLLQIIIIFIVIKCLIIIVIAGNHRLQRRTANLNLLQREELSSQFFSQLRFVLSLNFHYREPLHI